MLLDLLVAPATLPPSPICETDTPRCTAKQPLKPLVSMAPDPLSGGDRPQFSQSAPSPSALLRLGSRGEAVRWVQAQLRSQGFDLAADGWFGPQTQAAIQRFQSQSGLVPDGMVGPATWSRLRPEEAGLQIAHQAPLPDFAPRVLPAFSFHPIVPVAARPAPLVDPVWMGLLSLMLAAGTIYQVTRPASDRSEPQAAYFPTPIYPHHRPSEGEPAASSAARSLQIDTTDPIGSELIEAYADLPQASAADYLEDFLFDVLDPVSRHDLVVKLCHQQGRNEPEIQRLLLRVMAFLPLPFDQVGAFPTADKHTGKSYRYSLIDDLGGAFMMLKNELWMTRTARNWLQPSIPYHLTVRREDGYGHHVDMEYVIAIDA